ncbi:SDR family NAD(P)-dependent oxidoreductase [Halobacillus litoralis]|uniref:SDR family NAD(P)-dependent oxidoreductase n=1 Tax=Halobacillus litoralis TaxID=45668 RepID=UPI001CD5BCBA|nr:glucose 1-dehydrogenase [Halobacillus litoralis]MCA1022401.1 glucose 1-dehydrogenase [Halobacillus litoralis]
MRVKDRHFIVTGASGGMGQAVISKLMDEGASVTAVDQVRGRDAGDRAFQFVQADLTKEEDVQRVVDAAAAYSDRIDGVVNAAGMAQAAAPLEEVTTEFWDTIMNVNAKAAFLMCRAVVPYMKDQQGGAIVNIASIAVERARPGLSAYIASKGAVTAFSKALASELAPDGIRVNVIHPGPSDTGMLGEFVRSGGNMDDTKREVFQKSVPLGELIDPDDIAHAVVYLVSDEARMATGAVFSIDGGRGL